VAGLLSDDMNPLCGFHSEVSIPNNLVRFPWMASIGIRVNYKITASESAPMGNNPIEKAKTSKSVRVSQRNISFCLPVLLGGTT
jgi:hypothetical protein